MTMTAATKTCWKCGHEKPVGEFYGSLTRCKDCDNSRRRQTPTRVLANRARQRARQELVRRYPDEYQALVDYFTPIVHEEAEILADKAPNQEICSDEGHLNDADPVVLLKPGVRRQGQTTVDRISTGQTCAGCAAAHNRGHECPACGARPSVRKVGATIREVYA